MLLFLAAAALAGCGVSGPPQGVTVTGKILNGGAPLATAKLPPGEFIGEVRFIPQGEGSAEIEPLAADGTFRETGAGRGIPPGKYRLAVFHFIQGRGSDGLEGSFSDEKTPIMIDVPAAKSGGIFDLGTLDLKELTNN